MSNTVVIHHGRVIDPSQDLDTYATVVVQDGKIVSIGGSAIDEKNATVIDATGLIVCPGFVDLAARMREPGHEYKGSILSETEAAAAGGVTTLCCPPDTDPIIDTPAVAKLICDKARLAGFAKVLPLGALTQSLNGKQLSEMCALTEAGCVALSTTYNSHTDTLVLRRAFEYAATHNLTVLLNPNEHALSNGGCCNEGGIGTRLGLPGIPETAETIALARDLLLIEQTGVRAHIGRISSARGAQMITDAKARGVTVTADVAIHHLLLTDAAIDGYNTLFHVLPPLRREYDRHALVEAVVRGDIDAICSDHQPHEIAAKLAPFGETAPGIAGIQTLLPLALNLVRENYLTLPQLIQRLTQGPAGALHLNAGNLRVGNAADICIFDPDATWQLDATNSRSTGLNILTNIPLQGKVKYTLVDGRVVFP